MKSLALVTQIAEGVSTPVANFSVSLLELALNEALESESVAMTLSSSNSALSEYSTLEFLKTAANVAGKIKIIAKYEIFHVSFWVPKIDVFFSSANKEANLDVRVLNVLEKLLRLQSAFSVADEFALVLGGNDISNLDLKSLVISNSAIRLFG